MTFTLRGGFFTFWAILAHSVPWLPWHPQQACKGTIILAIGKLATYNTHMTLLQGPKDHVLPTLIYLPCFVNIVCECPRPLHNGHKGNCFK